MIYYQKDFDQSWPSKLCRLLMHPCTCYNVIPVAQTFSVNTTTIVSTNISMISRTFVFIHAKSSIGRMNKTRFAFADVGSRRISTPVYFHDFLNKLVISISTNLITCHVDKLGDFPCIRQHQCKPNPKERECSHHNSRI